MKLKNSRGGEVDWARVRFHQLTPKHPSGTRRRGAGSHQGTGVDGSGSPTARRAFARRGGVLKEWTGLFRADLVWDIGHVDLVVGTQKFHKVADDVDELVRRKIAMRERNVTQAFQPVQGPAPA